MRGKQVSPPAPFRKVSFGSRWEVTTHTAGMNPASVVTSGDYSLPLAGRVGRGYGSDGRAGGCSGFPVEPGRQVNAVLVPPGRLLLPDLVQDGLQLCEQVGTLSLRDCEVLAAL